MTNWDITWYIIIMQYFCHVEFCKRLQMSHNTKFCKSRCISLLYLHPFQQASSYWSPGIFFKRTASCINVLRCPEMTLRFQTKKQVQSPPALPSFSQSFLIFLDAITPEKAFPRFYTIYGTFGSWL